MKKIILIMTFLLASVSQGAVTSAVSFSADVRSFDEHWVRISANNNDFRIPRKRFEATNGPVRTGKILAHLNKSDFEVMKADRLIFK